jgi:hypothetical protein
VFHGPFRPGSDGLVVSALLRMACLGHGSSLVLSVRKVELLSQRGAITHTCSATFSVTPGGAEARPVPITRKEVVVVLHKHHPQTSTWSEPVPFVVPLSRLPFAIYDLLISFARLICCPVLPSGDASGSPWCQASDSHHCESDPRNSTCGPVLLLTHVDNVRACMQADGSTRKKSIQGR